GPTDRDRRQGETPRVRRRFVARSHPRLTGPGGTRKRGTFMRLEIQCQGVELSDEDRGQVARRFRFALGRFATKVKRVAIYFGSRSGPWGGVGQCCRVVVSLPPRKPLAIEVLERDRAAAVDRAADRAGLAVQRALESQRVEERDRQ